MEGHSEGEPEHQECKNGMDCAVACQERPPSSPSSPA
jgi:hypothetical protein